MSKFKIQNKSKIQIPKQKNLFYHLAFVICALLFEFFCGCQNKPLYKDTQLLMGTFVEVISSSDKAAPIAFAEIKRVENLLSKYNPESEISKLNHLGKLAVSRDTFYILKKAKEFWQLSNGAFDITVGPLMNLWGFTEKKYCLPKDEEIKETLSLVGSDKIVFNEKNNLVKFKVLGMQIDLGAIAKGYAVDCAIKRLKTEGINDCLINAGGDIYCLGTKYDRPWKVAIQNPRKSGLLDYLDLENCAVATSGDYEQYFTKDKIRYSHIFNPQTGYPANSGVISVTVLAPDCLTADALATSIFVLGKEKGEILAKKFPGVTVKIIEEKDVK